MKNTPDLETCPLCGTEATLDIRMDTGNFRIQCMNITCGISMERIIKDNLINCWNARVVPSFISHDKVMDLLDKYASIGEGLIPPMSFTELAEEICLSSNPKEIQCQNCRKLKDLVEKLYNPSFCCKKHNWESVYHDCPTCSEKESCEHEWLGIMDGKNSLIRYDCKKCPMSKTIDFDMPKGEGMGFHSIEAMPMSKPTYTACEHEWRTYVHTEPNEGTYQMCIKCHNLTTRPT